MATIKYTDKSLQEDLRECIDLFRYSIRDMVIDAHPEYTEDVVSWSAGSMYDPTILADIYHNKRSEKYYETAQVIAFDYAKLQDLEFVPVYEEVYYLSIKFEYVGE